MSGSWIERWFSHRVASARRLMPATHVVRKKDSPYSYFLLFGACVSCMCNMGMLQTFGVLYATLVEEFGGEEAITGTAWAGSMCVGISMLMGPVASAVITKFGNKFTCVVGSLLGALGFFLSSFTHNPGQLFLTYGLVAGIGSGLAYMPTVVAVHDYFEKRLSMATGLLVSSSSFGLLTISAFAQGLNESVGWRHTIRIESLLFVLSAISACSFVPRNVSESRENQRMFEVEGEPEVMNRMHCDWTIWRIPSFCMYVLGTSVVMFGYMIPLVYLLDQATSVGIEDNASLLSIFGGTALVGKLAFGFLADHKRTNHFVLLTFALAIHGIAMATIPTASNYNGLALIIVLLGLSEGCYIMLRPLLVNRLFGAERLHQAWGFVLSVNSIPYVLGPPCAGMLYRSTGSYTVAFYVGGVCELIGCLILASIPAVNKHRDPRANLARYNTTGENFDEAPEGASVHSGSQRIPQKIHKTPNHHATNLGFMGQPGPCIVDDGFSDISIDQPDIPVIFMKSDLPTVSERVDNPATNSREINLSHTSKIQQAVASGANKCITKIDIARKEFSTAATRDKATNIAKKISHSIVQHAQNVVNQRDNEATVATSEDAPKVLNKTSFAVIPYFDSESCKKRFTKRPGVNESGAAVSRSYDAVADFDLHLEAGATAQSHIRSLHTYFHDMIRDDQTNGEATPPPTNLRRKNLLKYVFKKKLQDSDAGKRTSVSFSSVEGIITKREQSA